MPDHQNRERYSFPTITAEQLGNIIGNANSTETLVKCAEDIGKALARPVKGKELTTNQIRAIFGEVRRIEGDWKIKPERAKQSLILLKPKMAYRAKKESGTAVGDLVSVLTPAIDLVKGNQENFTRFVHFLEAILAYHKAYGGN